MTADTPRTEFEKRKKDASYGALLSIVLILAIVVVGAFYLWRHRIEQNSQSIVLPDQTSTSTEATTTE